MLGFKRRSATPAAGGVAGATTRVAASGSTASVVRATAAGCGAAWRTAAGRAGISEIAPIRSRVGSERAPAVVGRCAGCSAAARRLPNRAVIGPIWVCRNRPAARSIRVPRAGRSGTGISGGVHDPGGAADGAGGRLSGGGDIAGGSCRIDGRRRAGDGSGWPVGISRCDHQPAEPAPDVLWHPSRRRGRAAVPVRSVVDRARLRTTAPGERERRQPD
jgi:hypothetical protein